MPSSTEYLRRVLNSDRIAGYSGRIKLLKEINRLLLFVVGIIFIVTVSYGIYLANSYGKERINKLTTTSALKKRENILTVNIKPPLKYDLNFASRRNIFLPHKNRRAKPQRLTNKKIKKFEQAIRILGISFDKHYEVILENVHTNETHFLAVGDFILDSKIIDIHGDHVVFELDREEVVLYHEAK